MIRFLIMVISVLQYCMNSDLDKLVIMYVLVIRNICKMHLRNNGSLCSQKIKAEEVCVFGHGKLWKKSLLLQMVSLMLLNKYTFPISFNLLCNACSSCNQAFRHKTKLDWVRIYEKLIAFVMKLGEKSPNNLSIMQWDKSSYL